MDKSRVSFAEYLRAKRSLDIRSINLEVFASVEPYLRGTEGSELRLLELGTAQGAMIERLLDWGGLGRGRYTAIDSDGSLLGAVPDRLAEWAGRHQGSLDASDSSLRLTSPGSSLVFDLVEEDIQSFLDQRTSTGQYNLILAHAVMDLLDLDRVLPSIRRALAPGGRIYFTVNFDGHTIFEPALVPDLDRRVMDAYHGTMDNRRLAGRQAGHSQSGRRLLSRLPEYGFEIVRAGASDWVIHPRGGAYTEDDETVLRWMLSTVKTALTGDDALMAGELNEWLDRRMIQLDRGELVFIAHQLDVHARLRG